MEKKFNVTSPSGKWYMTTNANGLKNVFHLHKEAIDRVQRETNDGGNAARSHFRQTGTKLPDGRWEIPVDLDVYDALKSKRLEGETLSDTIMRAIAAERGFN